VILARSLHEVNDMQNNLARGKHIPLILLLLLFVAFSSACQPLGMRVEQVSAESSLIKVGAQDCNYGGKIKSIEAVDLHTVRFTLCNSDPAFLKKLASPIFAIQDREFLSVHQGDSAAMSAQPNGSGPYRLKEFIPDQQITLEANPDYWGVPPKATTVLIEWASAPYKRETMLEQDLIDIFDRPVNISYYSISDRGILDLAYRPALNVSYLGMNNKYPPFTDERVRRGISALIERQLLVDIYYPLGSLVADQFIPPAMGIGYTPGYRWLDYNPEEGINLLKTAGFDFDQVLSLAFTETPTDYLPYPREIAKQIKAELWLAGIEVNLLEMEPEEFQNAIEEGQLAFYLSGWKADYPDPANFYETVFPADSKAFGKPYNDIIFMSREAANTSDLDLRVMRYNRLNELIKLHVPAIPLAHGNSALAVNKNVQGLLVGPLNENLEDVVTPWGDLRFSQTHAPTLLWPSDESDADTLRVTRLLYDTLVEYVPGGTDVKPSLADYWESNPERTEWTFYLHYGVKFTNGAELDANDVVATFAAQWDTANPNHTGRTGEFQMFEKFFGSFLNEDFLEKP